MQGDKTIYYAGIGSRETPSNVLVLMEEFAVEAASRGVVLRSGAAPGADAAFEKGCGSEPKQIFIPWNGFQEKREDNIATFLPLDESGDLAAKVHPYYRTMRRPNKLLISRNMHQVMGPDLTTPVEFVVCWTKDGCTDHFSYSPEKTGGTGSAIALASMQKIRVFNLFNRHSIWQAYEKLVELTGWLPR